MFYQNIVSIFLLILLSYEPLYNAQNSDSVLKFDRSGYLEMFDVQYSGKGLSVCNWLQIEGYLSQYFIAYNNQNTKLLTNVNFLSPFIQGSIMKGGSNFYTQATDCNLKMADWFHVCFARDQFSITIYYNGYPLQNYTEREKFDDNEPENIMFRIGDFVGYGGGSIYQLNIFEKAITDREAFDLHNCKSIPGDLLSWQNVTGKSSSIQFRNSIDVVQKPAPCPNPPEYQPINCETGEPLPEPADPGSSSGNPSSNMGNSEQSSDSGSGSPSSSSGDSDQPSGSGSGSPTSSGNSNSGTSSQNMNMAQSPATSRS